MGLLARWRARRAPAPVVLDPDDPSLVVVVEAFEAARADSAVLAEAAERGVALDAPVLLRHHLVGLSDEAVAAATGVLAQDGYEVFVARAAREGVRCPAARAAPPSTVLVTRTQVLTALSASQERSRMAGLAQRLGGDVRGYDALAPVRPAP